ncbi:DUF6153 family protein [Nakamurella panacisegetis]|uniref:DUF6153 family protein n=1 Tax=Nakamurella panacisegetis TaxID=1090615 RepID=UPI000B8A5965|nr:DUF6153 family protein [Nakamurella panacisegetis]
MIQTAERTSPRGRVWVAARWLLLGLVIAGIVGMHVLSEHDAGGGHGMMMNPGAVAAEPAHHGAMPAAMNTASGGPMMSGVPDSGGGMSSGMAACILFLVIGAGLVALALLVLRRAAGRPAAAGPWWLGSGRSERGPPGSGAPRISLCVLRV